MTHDAAEFPRYERTDYQSLSSEDANALRTLRWTANANALFAVITTTALVVSLIWDSRTNVGIWLATFASWLLVNSISWYLCRRAAMKFAKRYNDGTRIPVGIGGLHAELIARDGVAYRRVR